MVENLFKQISQQIVCSKCEEEFLAGTTDSRTLQDYTKLDVGFTESGLQVWCRRHDTNVVHIDFKGRELKADFRTLHTRVGLTRDLLKARKFARTPCYI